MEHRIKVVLGNNNTSWYNKDQVIDTLYSLDPQEPVVIDTIYEGFSMQHLGLADVLWQWVKQTNRDPRTVKLDTPNQIEDIGFEFYCPHEKSHFFDRRLIRYHAPPQSFVPRSKQFAYFVGKYTPDRNMIARDILQRWPDQFVISVMTSKYSGPGFWDDEVYAIGSLDQAEMLDQWRPGKNTNQSLLRFYDRFDIELIAETFVYGTSFFPTEKTVRPIMGSKPFLAYAPRNYLKNLRDLGFRTFDTVWDEHYDQYEGAERWHHMGQVIDYLTQQSPYSEQLTAQLQEIVVYNYKHLQEISG